LYSFETTKTPLEGVAMKAELKLIAAYLITAVAVVVGAAAF
jgi:hypothetical protein